VAKSVVPHVSEGVWGQPWTRACFHCDIRAWRVADGGGPDARTAERSFWGQTDGPARTCTPAGTPRGVKMADKPFDCSDLSQVGRGRE